MSSKYELAEIDKQRIDATIDAVRTILRLQHEVIGDEYNGVRK